MGGIAPGTRSADVAFAAVNEALHSQSNARIGAVRVLPAFGPRAAAAIPQLREWQNGSDEWLKAAATSALTAIEGARSGGEKSAK